MKINKIFILSIMLISMLSLIVSADSGTDRFMFNNYLGDGSPDSYLTRANGQNAIDWNVDSITRCNAGISAYDYGVYPFEFLTTFGHLYTGMLVPTQNTLHIMGANCTDLDSISMGGDIIAVPTIVPYSYIDGVQEYPEFAVLVKNSNDSTIHLKIYTINPVTSLLYLAYDTATGLTDETEILGLTSGCTDSMGVCPHDETIFAFYNQLDSNLYIQEGDSGSLISLAGGDTNLNIITPNHKNNNIIIDDWDGDNIPDIIIHGLGDMTIDGGGKTVYTTLHVYNYNLVSNTISSLDSWHTFLTSKYYTNQNFVYRDMYSNVVQYGSKGSPLEISYFYGYDSSGAKRAYQLRNNDGTLALDFLISSFYLYEATYDWNDDGFDDIIIYDTSSVKVYSGFDDSLLNTYSVNLMYGTFSGSEFMDSRIYNINNHATGINVLLANGETWEFYQNSTAVRLADWNTLLTNSTYGNIVSADLNGDDDREIIFASSSAITISSNSHYEPSFTDLTVDLSSVIGQYAYDLDGGIVYTYADYTYNGTSLGLINTNHTVAHDTCSEVNTDIVQEFYLDGNNIESINYDCTTGGYYSCIIGQCVNQSEFEIIDEGIQNGSIIPIVGGIISETETPTTPTTDEEVSNIFTALQNNLGLIFALIFIIAMVGVTATSYSKEPFVLALVGIVSSIIMVTLGLLDVVFLIIILISLAMLMVLAMTVFNKK